MPEAEEQPRPRTDYSQLAQIIEQTSVEDWLLFCIALNRREKEKADGGTSPST